MEKMANVLEALDEVQAALDKAKEAATDSAPVDVPPPSPSPVDVGDVPPSDEPADPAESPAEAEHEQSQDEKIEELRQAQIDIQAKIDALSQPNASTVPGA
jgi:hypothetical protein